MSSGSQLVVIQTLGGKEALLNTYIDKVDSVHELVVESFYPMRKINKKFRGEWKTVTERLFPGYLFVDTEDSKGLFLALKQIPALSKILGDLEVDYVTLAPEEEAFVRKIGKNRGDHSIGISTVQIESDSPYKKGDRVNVIAGDLKDFEGEVVGYDFRKRKALIRTGLFGGTIIHVGIELLEKHPS